jgi:hypothetical protein
VWLQLEGIVVKALDSAWVVNGRNSSWVKMKPDYVHATDIDAVIIGVYNQNRGPSESFPSIVLPAGCLCLRRCLCPCTICYMVLCCVVSQRVPHIVMFSPYGPHVSDKVCLSQGIELLYMMGWGWGSLWHLPGQILCVVKQTTKPVSGLYTLFCVATVCVLRSDLSYHGLFA